MKGDHLKRRVWLLGAGFSRSLGGPLMNDLLSPAARREILARYREQIREQDVDLVFWLFHYGAGFPDGALTSHSDSLVPFRTTRQWRDAEQFMEVVDNARSDSGRRDLIDDTFDLIKSTGLFQSLHTLPPMEELAQLVRRVIAASCSTFLEGITPESARDRERWLPYQDWIRRLHETDSILTFNYDRVIELLSPIVDNSNYAVPVAGVDNISEAEEIELARTRHLPLLYKLHGSVNWNYENNRINKMEWVLNVLQGQYRLAIATPGESKLEMASGVFGQLWRGAVAALREADEVFIVGFRFPQSDAYPRNQLLAALRQNDNKGLNVHVVLGPEQNADLRRVLALLSWTVGAEPKFDRLYQRTVDVRQLTAYSLFAEDFLTVWAQHENTMA